MESAGLLKLDENELDEDELGGDTAAEDDPPDDIEDPPAGSVYTLIAELDGPGR